MIHRVYMHDNCTVSRIYNRETKCNKQGIDKIYNFQSSTEPNFGCKSSRAAGGFDIVFITHISTFNTQDMDMDSRCSETTELSE